MVHLDCGAEQKQLFESFCAVLETGKMSLYIYHEGHTIHIYGFRIMFGYTEFFLDLVGNAHDGGPPVPLLALV